MTADTITQVRDSKGLAAGLEKVDLQARVMLDPVPPAAEEMTGVTPVEKPFEYGWCKTDHKNGKNIRGGWRHNDADYLNDEPYASRVHAMLDQLGLPKPKKEEVFRGTHHDLLFLNSHGVVLRIGPQEVDDLFNPGILQPLGWLEDKENPVRLDGKELPLTVAIYPGVELTDQYLDKTHKPEMVGSLYDLLSATQQGTGDVCTTGNTGIIRVLDDDGKEVAVQILVDADNSFNGASKEMREKTSTRMKEQRSSASSAGAPIGKGEALFNTLRTVFNAAKNVKYWERAFEAHQPLRQLFWEAFNDVPAVTGVGDAEKCKKFWDTCAAVTNAPAAVTLPLWRMEKAPGGEMSFIRDEIHVPHMVLYRPWTGQEADQIVQPIMQSKGFREAVAKEHKAQGLVDQNGKKYVGISSYDWAGGDAPREKNLAEKAWSIGRRAVKGFINKL